MREFVFRSLSYQDMLEGEIRCVGWLREKRRRSKMWKNSLDVAKLSYNPLQSVNDHQGTPYEMAGK